MTFIQDGPTLGNQYRDDRVLRSYLARVLEPAVAARVAPELDAVGEVSGGELYLLQLADRQNEPRHLPFDPWGRRIDRIEHTALWQRAARIAVEHGLVATAYERASGAASRIHQFALVYLFDPSSDVYTCPLAMTDGAARTLLAHKATALAERALPRLLSRDPALAWTSGQWMTERTGGSDVGLSETRAEPTGGSAYGVPDAHRLFGNKWFTSAAAADMALTLGRPPGAPAGGKGLALFYLETRDALGAPNGVVIHRLKDKLGTRKLPTAELDLEGALAAPVAGLANGVRAITPLLNTTRTWNAVCSVAAMRRALALARDYARRRSQFGAPVLEQPLHADTLAGMQAEYEGAFHLAFRVVELLGLEEAAGLDDRRAALLRIVTPIAKLLTAKQAVAIASEALECFAGAGYCEDTGIPRLLRDAQVLSIWEGTTNVLALDLLRALRKTGLGPFKAELEELTATLRDDALGRAGKLALASAERVERWLAEQLEPAAVEAGARRAAFGLGRALELALLARHAQWALDVEKDPRPARAAARFALGGLGELFAPMLEPSAALAADR
ncbi:MAG: acyl-CoA dehydrogenase family protein [Polyangiaceae bacterium]|nr:acyl-CoA dehydrogenase family protein [Polyangiaceae bacterium]